MRSYRLARLAAIAVPLTIGMAVFLAGWLAPTISGAGLSEENRPIGFVLMSTFGAGGWVFGTSAMFTIFLSPARLPRAARLVAALVVRGLRSMASAEEIWRGEPAVTDHDRAVSRAHLLGLAVVELPPFLFWRRCSLAGSSRAISTARWRRRASVPWRPSSWHGQCSCSDEHRGVGQRPDETARSHHGTQGVMPYAAWIEAD